MNRDSGAGFFAGLLIGAVIGLAVGFLYAPQSGDETRKIVKEKVASARDVASKAASKVREAAERKFARDEE
jgi:gas vesicle protein